MKSKTQIILGIIGSMILITIGLLFDLDILSMIGGFGLGYYLGKLSIFIGMEKKNNGFTYF